MARYLITGGAGFIGSNLAHSLVSQGESVRILDDFSSGRLKNLDGIDDRVEIVRGDLRDPGAVARAVEGVEIVFHQAALNSNPRSIKEPGPTNDVNVGGTVLLLEAARQARVRRLMKDDLNPRHGARHNRWIPQVPSNDLHPIVNSLQVCRAAAGKIIQDPDRVLSFSQSMGQIRPNEAGPSRNQVSRHGLPSSHGACRTG